MSVIQYTLMDEWPIRNVSDPIYTDGRMAVARERAAALGPYVTYVPQYCAFMPFFEQMWLLVHAAAIAFNGEPDHHSVAAPPSQAYAVRQRSNEYTIVCAHMCCLARYLMHLRHLILSCTIVQVSLETPNQFIPQFARTSSCMVLDHWQLHRFSGRRECSSVGRAS